MKLNIRNILAFLPLLAACNSEIQTDSDIIGLQGIISNEYDTKAAVVSNPYMAKVPSETEPLNADVWFSNTAGNYSDTDLHRTIEYIGPSVTNPSPDGSGKFLRYDAKGASIYCVGLYPLGAWTTTDGITATADIDGVNDLMFAPQKTGTNSSPFSATPQTFNHQLTWVKIVVRTDSNEKDYRTISETWGHLRQITISSATKATLTLGTGAIDFSGNQEIIAFEGDAEILNEATELGDVMVSPATMTSGFWSFNISLTCDNYSKTNVPVRLAAMDGGTYSGSTVGKLFVLTLYFKSLTSVSYSATLQSWEDEGRVLELDTK